MRLPLTYAGEVHDRTERLASGRVQPRGIDLRFLELPVEDVFLRMLQHLEYDASEMSLASYAIARAGGRTDLLALPVFPSRHFRLSSVYVREDAPLRRLQDLRGARVGVPEYQMTAAVWVRGILEEHFEVPVRSVRWFTGRPERQAIELPEGVSVEPLSGGLLEALGRGDLDAVMVARLPVRLGPGSGLRRLLPDSREVERSYFDKTGIFPIMHTVVVQERILRSDPWVARSLQDAFTVARDAALEALGGTTVLEATLPWVGEELEDTRRALGEDFWPYGLAANRHTVDTLLGYLHGQGLTATRPRPEELFAPQLLDT